LRRVGRAASFGGEVTKAVSFSRELKQQGEKSRQIKNILQHVNDRQNRTMNDWVGLSLDARAPCRGGEGVNNWGKRIQK